MPDRLLVEAEKMLRGMERRFGIPTDIDTTAQERADDDNTTLGSTCPAGGHEADGRAS